MAKLNSDVAFFYKYAGWSYMPGKETPRQGRMRGARALADAERRARAAGLTVEWADDPEEYMLGDAEDRAPDTVLMARIPDPSDPRRTLASLGGIGDPTREYMRVVAAELALEALGDRVRRPRGAARARGAA